MSVDGEAARALFLELRAAGLALSVRDDPDGSALDYGIAVEGLGTLTRARAQGVSRRVLEHEDELVRILLDRRDPDLDAVRKEGHR